EAALYNLFDQGLVARVLPQAKIGQLLVERGLGGEDKSLLAAKVHDALHLSDVPFFDDRADGDVRRPGEARFSQLQVFQHLGEDSRLGHGACRIRRQRIQADNQAVQGVKQSLPLVQERAIGDQNTERNFKSWRAARASSSISSRNVGSPPVKRIESVSLRMIRSNLMVSTVASSWLKTSGSFWVQWVQAKLHLWVT